MANTLLTPTKVTREALRILHQKLNFIGTIDRQYDDSFAKTGAKIGDTLKIRLPNEYTVRTGRALQVQDTTESSVDLTVATQKGVDTTFTTADLTLSLDDFSSRILDPAMSVLAANIEADAMSMFKDVYNEISDVGAAITLRDVLNGQQLLTDSLAPDPKTLNLNTLDNVDLVEALSGLFNDPSKIGENFREGMVANQFVGYGDVFQNTLWPTHTTGSDDGTGDHLVDGASQTGAAITTGSEGTGTLLKGDIVTFDGVNRVHPETKANTGSLMRFVVTSDYSAAATTLNISPALTVTGAKQNVTASPADDAPIRKRESDESTAIGTSADYKISMGYHKEAFAFASADLEMPDGVHFSSREVFDGISMRIVRDYDINSDLIPARIDVLYGYKTTRAQLATRYGFN